MYPTTCIHAPAGLCPACQADHDEDPTAWAEFGRHPAGIARWRELQAEIAADCEDVPAERTDAEIPF